MEALIPKVEASELHQQSGALLYQAGLLRAEVELAQGGIDEVIRRLERPGTPGPEPSLFCSSLLGCINVPFHRDILLARAYTQKGGRGQGHR